MPPGSEGQVEVLNEISTKTEESGKTQGYGRAININFDEEPASKDGVDTAEEDVSEQEEDSDTEEQSKKEQAEDEDSENESDSEPEDEVKEKNRKGFQERQRRKLDLLEARQKAEEVHNENQELRKRLEALERGEKPAIKAESQISDLPDYLQKEPDPDDFDTHAAYTRAVARHENAIIKWEEEQQSVKSKLTERQLNVKTKLTNAVNNALEKYDDFLDLTEGQAAKATQTVIEYFEDIDEGMVSEMMYYFGQNPDEYEKIVKSGPIAASRALAKIEGKLEGTVSTAKKVVKSRDIPPPIKPLSGTGSRKTSALEDKNASYSDVRKELMALKRR